VDNDVPESIQASLGRSEQHLENKKNARENARKNRQAGLEYFSPRSGKWASAKSSKFLRCSCSHKCSDVLPSETRKSIHRRFWDLADWTAQSNFILNSVKCVTPQRRTAGNSKVNFMRQYHLDDKRVCQKVFCSTLDINHMRVDYVLRHKNKFGIASPDKRGAKTPNKIPTSMLNDLENFLNQFPKYESHYSNSKRIYFDSRLTRKKIHQLFLEYQFENNRHCKMSYMAFCKEFNNYNVGIYVPKSDTCHVCDEAAVKLDAQPEASIRLEIEDMRAAHQRRAECARDSLRAATTEAKVDSTLLAISFDVQQTQPIPYLSTNKSYYTRHLSLYNFGINILRDNTGIMCTWHEAQGKRGSLEICSSLYEFLKSQDLEKISRIHSFSDSCGGQNRNRNVIAFKMWCCNEFNIAEWNHTYMESGHSFLPNDQNFAKIEQGKKKMRSINSFDEWMSVIKSSQNKNPFKVMEMGGKFLDIDHITNDRVFTSKCEDGSKFSFLRLKWFNVKKNCDDLLYKYSNSNSEPTGTLNVRSKSQIHLRVREIDRSSSISSEKKKDLLSLLPFMPHQHHSFFKNLPCSNEEESE